MTCGGYAVRQGKVITIFYRIFIYDRYNWDVESNGVTKQGKETAVPESPLSILLDDGKMDAIQGLTLPNGTQPYFRRGKGYDGKTDSYIVNDALMGAGRIRRCEEFRRGGGRFFALGADRLEPAQPGAAIKHPIRGNPAMRWFLPCAAIVLAAALFPVLSSAERGSFMTRTECAAANLAVTETALAAVLGQAPRIIGPAFCEKSVYSSDLVALVEIDSADAPGDWRFSSAGEEAEAPLHLLAKLNPEDFASVDPAKLEFAGGFSRELRKNVYLLRLPSGRLFALVTDFF